MITARIQDGQLQIEGGVTYGPSFVQFSERSSHNLWKMNTLFYFAPRLPKYLEGHQEEVVSRIMEKIRFVFESYESGGVRVSIGGVVGVLWGETMIKKTKKSTEMLCAFIFFVEDQPYEKKIIRGLMQFVNTALSKVKKEIREELKLTKVPSIKGAYVKASKRS